jgi:DNA mismatch repair protein MutS
MKSQIYDKWPILKAKLPDCIVLVRIGEWHESFFDDAPVVARICEVGLTNRREIPMAGIFYRHVENAVTKLTKAGHKVAMIDLEKLAEVVA